MRFELSELVHTTKSSQNVLDTLETQLRKVSQRVDRVGPTVVAKSIEASFGSINRTDTTTFYATEKENGVLCVADVKYRPSVAFWIILVLLLFTYILWLLPIVFYLVQKRTVRSAIEDVFRRVSNDFESGDVVRRTLPADSVYCTKCGARLMSGEDLKFCSSCGTPVAKAQAANLQR